MKKFRWIAVVAALIIAAPVLAPSPVDARAGGGSGAGSRGGKTGEAPAPTQTAPTAKPVERSTTPQQAQKPANAAPAPTAQPGGFMARNPFLAGMMGGLLGAGLIGMLFGGGFGAGLGGMAGMLGLLVQLLLIGGLAYLAVRLWRARSGAPQPAHAGNAQAMPRQALPDAPLARSGGAVPMGGGWVSAAPPLAIVADDYTAFESLLSGIQSAYSRGDLAALRGLVTPEMLGYFSEQLSANASRGVENKIDAVKLEQGDLSEAWSEGAIDYATVAMRFSMIDVMRTIADGRIVEGNDRVRTEATEVWTFLRSRGGNWILSAIQQT